jgi:solute:Na+ symporter, SSS family
VGIGFAARRSVKTSLDLFLSGRSLSAWATGLAFISANLAATEILGLGFVLSFGYWTTNFAEVQRALSTKNLSAAQRTPPIAAFPKNS